MLTQTLKMRILNVICVVKYLQLKRTWQTTNQVMITVDMGVTIVEYTTEKKFI